MFKALHIFLLSTFIIGCGDSGDSTKSDVTIEPTIKTVAKSPLPIIPLEDKIEQISVFIELAYQIQYFHPSDGASQTIWEKFISYGIYRSANTNDNEEFISVLKELFENIAPNLKINGYSAIDIEAPKETDTVKITKNQGYRDQYETENLIFNRTISTDRYSELKKQGWIKSISSQQTLPLSIEIDLPIVLTVINSQTQPESSGPTGDYENYDASLEFTDLYARLTAAGKLWAVIQHFYPYLNELDLNWQNELSPLLAGCIDSTASCGMAMRKLLAKTADNHNFISSLHTTLGGYTAPIGFTWLNDKVLAVYKESDDIAISIGDELVAIDGVAIESILEEKKPYSHRSENRKLELLTSFDLLRGEEQQTVQLTLKGDDGIEYQLTTNKTASASDIYQAIKYKMTSNNSDKYRKLDENIHYVNLSLIEGSDVDSTVEQLKEAKAVVIDLRNYPNWQGWRGLLSHFVDHKINTLPMYKNTFLLPNQYLASTNRIDQIIQPQQPMIDIPVIVLASSYSISQNEHALGYVQDANIPILGEATYGINGNVNYIQLLGGDERGGVTVGFTGIKVTQHDGSILRGVGIQPDIQVPVTIDALIKGEDVQLQAAIDYLRQELNL